MGIKIKNKIPRKDREIRKLLIRGEHVYIRMGEFKKFPNQKEIRIAQMRAANEKVDYICAILDCDKNYVTRTVKKVKNYFESKK